LTILGLVTIGIVADTGLTAHNGFIAFLALDGLFLVDRKIYQALNWFFSWPVFTLRIQ